jgi:hypothetical protein
MKGKAGKWKRETEKSKEGYREKEIRYEKQWHNKFRIFSCHAM